MQIGSKSKSPILKIKSSLWSIVHGDSLKSVGSVDNYFKVHTNPKPIDQTSLAKNGLDPKYYNLDSTNNSTKKIFKKSRLLMAALIALVVILASLILL